MTETLIQPRLDDILIPDAVRSTIGDARINPNTIGEQDRSFHEWYRFVLAYPPHLVRDYIQKFGLSKGATILDPFCGTGTTAVEARLNGMRSIGLEANPFPQFAASVKTDWSIDPDEYEASAERIADQVRGALEAQGINDRAVCTFTKGALLRDISPDAKKLLIANSISPMPLHKTLILLDAIREHRGKPYYNHARLALGAALVTGIGNLRFGPEVGVGKLKDDVPVISIWLAQVRRMVSDLRTVQGRQFPAAHIYLADARNVAECLRWSRVDAVITSPPYPNEKDYTRTTRLESVLLGFYDTKAELRAYKKTLLRSNTRGVYQEDNDDKWIEAHPVLTRIAAAIETRRVELNKTSGFEKLYARTMLLYFGGMWKHLMQLREVLNPGAQLAYVVGDQASYLQVMIRTGQLLADLAQYLGYEVEGIDLFRTRYATATQTDLREEVVLLKWPTTRGKVFIMSKSPKATVYQQLVAEVFKRHYQEGINHFDFTREELFQVADALDLPAPKNMGDVPYTFRYRGALPDSIRATAPTGKEWLIKSVGRSKYRFVLSDETRIVPTPGRTVIKVPDATPGIIVRYAKGDEQALLAIIRYNRLIDIFTGLTCYSLQNHLRTTVPGIGQVETDELYVGVDKQGAHYIIPVQAKGFKDRLGIVQIEQDIALCAERYPNLICRPVAAQFVNTSALAEELEHTTIVLFAFQDSEEGITISAEKQYRLVPPDSISDIDLATYRNALDS